MLAEAQDERAILIQEVEAFRRRCESGSEAEALRAQARRQRDVQSKWLEDVSPTRMSNCPYYFAVMPRRVENCTKKDGDKNTVQQ